MTTLYANPYDISAVGFYFNSLEDFEAKYKKHAPVEEYEIDFIDGDSYELFDAVGVNQANLSEWYGLQELEEQEQIALCYLLDMGICCDLQEAQNTVEDVDLFEGTLIEWAEDFIESTGMLDSMPESLRYYFDVEAYARDCSLNDQATEWEYDNKSYVVEVH